MTCEPADQFERARVVDRDLRLSTRSEQSAIGAVRDRKRAAVQGRDQLAGAGVPNLGAGFVFRCRGGKCHAMRREAHALDVVALGPQLRDHFAALGFANGDDILIAAGGDEPSIRRERHAPEFLVRVLSRPLGVVPSRTM